MTARNATRDVARSVKATGRVDGVLGPLVLATAGVHDARRVGAGFLATWGYFGVQAHFYDPQVLGERRALMTQLRAVFVGLHHLLYWEVPHGTPVEVRLDHAGAVAYLQDWAQGGTGMPEGYRVWRINDAVSPLERLRQTVACHAAALTFRNEPANPGNILHQAAHSLATLGLRTSKGLNPVETLPSVAREYAAVDLAAHQRHRPCIRQYPMSMPGGAPQREHDSARLRDGATASASEADADL